MVYDREFYPTQKSLLLVMIKIYFQSLIESYKYNQIDYRLVQTGNNFSIVIGSLDEYLHHLPFKLIVWVHYETLLQIDT